jgi:hypothetical protein
MLRAPHLEAMTVCVLEARIDDAFTRRRSDVRTANCGSLRVSNPTLRLGPRVPTGPSDEREESIER